jgi:hypothetical protein
MAWKIRFRGKDFIGEEGWEPEFELEVIQDFTEKEKLQESAEIIIHAKGDAIDDVTIHLGHDRNRFPLRIVHGQHPTLGEVYMFSGVPIKGDAMFVALYDNDIFDDPPFNDTPLTGDGT